MLEASLSRLTLQSLSFSLHFIHIFGYKIMFLLAVSLISVEMQLDYHLIAESILEQFWLHSPRVNLRQICSQIKGT